MQIDQDGAIPPWSCILRVQGMAKQAPRISIVRRLLLLRRGLQNQR